MPNKPAKKVAAKKPAKKAPARKVTPVLPVRDTRPKSPQPVQGRKPPVKKATAPPQKGKKGGKGGGKGKVGPGTGNSPVAPVVDPDAELKARAEATVSAELDPQIAELQRQVAENKITGTDAMAAVERMYGLAQQASEENRAAAESTYNQGEQKIRDLYTNLSADINKTYEGAAADARAEQARLGTTTDTSGLTRDQAYLSGLANLQGAGQETSLNNRGIDQDTMMRRLSAGIAADSAVKRTEISRDMNALGRELSAQAGILSSTRQARVLSLLGELQDKRASTEAEAEQQAFLNQIAARKLGISERQLAANIAKQRADVRIAAAKVRLTRKKNESDAAYKARMAAIAANNSSIKAQEAAIRAENAKVERDLKRSQVMKNVAQTQKTEQGSGFAAARSYVIQQTKGMPGGSKVASTITGLLTEFPPAVDDKYRNTRYGSAYQRMIKTNRYRSLPASAKRLLADAYQRAYGK